MATIHTVAQVSFDYDTEDGIASTLDEAIEDTRDILHDLNAFDFEIHAFEGARTNEFREAVENVATSYNEKRLTADRALSALAAILADDESGTDV